MLGPLAGPSSRYLRVHAWPWSETQNGAGGAKSPSGGSYRPSLVIGQVLFLGGRGTAQDMDGRRERAMDESGFCWIALRNSYEHRYATARYQTETEMGICAVR